jgi:16S rRNA (cytosine1402-N4)-methyltransferase
MERNVGHITVLLHEAVDALDLKADSIVVDATGGGGGHSERILETLGPTGTLVIIDSDPAVVKTLTERFADSTAAVHVVLGNFRNLERILKDHGITAIDAVLADLGWNSMQFESGGKGFSFKSDEPLAMTYGPVEEYPFSAYDIVNEWSEEVIADVLYAYADERYARRIAKVIVDARSKEPIRTSHALAEIVKRAVPGAYRNGRIHPATKTFQALRVAVNDELDALKEFLEAATRVTKEGGRIAVITFHSIEDRIAKRFFKDMERAGIGMPVHKKPIVPTAAELAKNPRARSAKLRTFLIQ